MNDMTSDSSDSLHRAVTGAILCVTLLLFLIVPYSTFAVRSEWQQRVDYNIDVTLVDSLHSLRGRAEVLYVNNSPDTLGTLWFRLAPAALQGGSVVDTTIMRGRRNRFSKINEGNWGDLTVGYAWAKNRNVSFEQDYSLGQLHLDPPLLPGDSVDATLLFRTRFPTGGAGFRIEYRNGQYKGAYWYPMIAPYTPEFGWTVNRYFGTAEAYGEFGDYTIRYNVPYKYIIASTGKLVNEHEVLPPERMQGLSIDNPDPLPVPDGEEGDSLVTWVFEANQVPDVAFAMDPMFLIDRIDYGHFEAWAFPRRDQVEDWSDAAEICGWTVKELEKLYGKYPWPRVKASYSWSAMEYPMLTMMSSSSPQYVYVMMHEIIHNYHPMILHSNSVDEQWIDEGFTAFIEQELSAKWHRTRWDRKRTYTEGLFDRTFQERDDVVRGTRPYLEAVLAGEDLPMVRASDTALDYMLLRVSSYYKTPVMLNALRGVIGEEAFWRGFRVLYENHALTHVGAQDIITSFEETSGRSLKWFFDQFLYSSGDIDYRIADYKRIWRQDHYQINLDVERVGDVRLPLRIGILTADGDTLRGEVPYLLTDSGLPGYDRWGIWDQWHMPNTTLSLTLDLKSGIEPAAVVLDPDGFYTDRSPTDNRTGFRLPEWEFDPVLWPVEPPPVDHYRVLVGPAAGYNKWAGPLAGAAFRGSYMEREGVFLADVLAAPLEPEERITSDGTWKQPRVQFRLGVAQPITRSFGPVYTTVYLGAMHDDEWAEGGLWRSWRSWTSWYDRMTVSGRIGVWRRHRQNADYTDDTVILPGTLAPQSWETTDNAIAYLSFKTNATGKLGQMRWYGSVRGVSGLEEGFSTFEINGNTSGRWIAGLDFGVEMRGALLNSKPPRRFADTMGGAAPYLTLGQPVSGGTWDDSEPYRLTPAAFASPIGDVDTDRFLATRFVPSTSFGKVFNATSSKPLGRLLHFMRAGVYGAAVIFRDTGSDEPARMSSGYEVGWEMGVHDMYGLTLLARHPFLWRYEYGYSHFNQEISAWEDLEWTEQLAFYIQIDLNKFWR